MILLSDLFLTRKGTEYWLGLQHDDLRLQLPTDGDLGQIMSAFSWLLKTLETNLTGTPFPDTAITRSGLVLDRWTIERTKVEPLAWRMQMAYRQFQYDCLMDRNLEMVINGFQGAMKFFAYKTKLITFDADLVRNREQAAGFGLLTKEDG